jgi:hypothetical protein
MFSARSLNVFAFPLNAHGHEWDDAKVLVASCNSSIFVALLIIPLHLQVKKISFSTASKTGSTQTRPS